MSWKRKILIGVVIIVIILAAGLGLVVLNLDPGSIKERLEKSLSAATGLHVSASEGVALNIYPPGIRVVGLVLRAGEKEILTAPLIKADVAILPLLMGELQLSKLVFEEPRILLPPGGLDSWPSESTDSSRGFFKIDSVSIENGSLRFLDGDMDVVLDSVDLEIDTMRLDEKGRLSFAGDFYAASLNMGRIEMTGLAGAVSGKDGIYRFDSLAARLYESEVEGVFSIDRGGKHAVWKLQLEGAGLSLAELFQSLTGRPLFEGSMRWSADLQAGGPGRLLDSLDGSVRMSGTDIIQHGFDLDATVREFRTSRNLVDLMDIAFFVFAGPVGLLVSKSTDALDMVMEKGTNNRQVIEKFVFNWSIDHSLARAEDVALRSPENRLAVKGAINLSTMRYENMVLALLNTEGCAELTEKISGPVTSPSVEKTGILGSLSGSLAGVFKQGWELLDFRDCIPFYHGDVSPSSPEESK